MVERPANLSLAHARAREAEEDPFMDARESLGAPSTAKRFELVAFEKIKLGSGAVYLVKGLIPRVGITVLYGPPKCGKSFWLFDLLMHVALGWDYRGRRVKPGSVVYCAFEGAEGFKARVEAFRRDKLGTHEGEVPFHLVAARMSFAKDHQDLVASIRAAMPNDRPAAVVLDTLKRSLAGSESDDKDMGAYVEAADAVRESFECAVIIVHHSGLEGGRPRGSTSLPGAADAQLACDKNDAGQVVVTVQLMKDGPEGDSVASTMRVVDVGIDEDGDKITSLVVDPAEPASISAKASRLAKMPKGAKIALAALHGAIDAVGIEPPPGHRPHVPPSVSKVVTRQQWRAACVSRGISTSDKESAVRMATDRASAYLIAERFISVWEDCVWPVSSTPHTAHSP